MYLMYFYFIGIVWYCNLVKKKKMKKKMIVRFVIFVKLV